MDTFFCSTDGSSVFPAKRAAELHLVKTKAIAQGISCPRELVQFCASRWIEQIELLVSVREPAERHSQQTDSPLRITVFAKQRKKGSECVRIKLDRLRQCFRSRVGVEAGVTNRESERPRTQTRLPQAFAGLLRKVAEHGFERTDVSRVFTERVVVRNGFRFGIQNEFVGIAAARFAVQRCSPLPKDFFELFLR